MACTLTPTKNSLALSGFLQTPHLQEVSVAVAGLFLSFLKITALWLCQDPLPLLFPGKPPINIPGSDVSTKASRVFPIITPASLQKSVEQREVGSSMRQSRLTFRSKAWRLTAQPGQAEKQTGRAGFWDSPCSNAKLTAAPTSGLESHSTNGNLGNNVFI